MYWYVVSRVLGDAAGNILYTQLWLGIWCIQKPDETSALGDS